MEVVSYGGGVQSTALLVMAAQGALDVKTFLFANVGDDSEHPATLRYVREVAMPYAKEHGIAIIELHYHKRGGELETLYQHVTKPSQKMEIIPVRLQSGKPGMRSCTTNWKIRVIAQYVRKHGATKKSPAYMHMGISLDEFRRMRISDDPCRINVYPLIDRRMNRQDCMNVITRAGLPVPPKSSCWFCPFHRLTQWQEMAENEPELFQRAVEMERLINERRTARGRDAVFFTDKMIPLNDAIGDMQQGKLFSEAEPTCDSGHCFV